MAFEVWSSLSLEGYHTKESDNTSNYTYEDEDEYTKTPMMKIIATFHKCTTTSNQPHSIVSE